MVLKGCLACEDKHEDEWFVDCKCICHDYEKKIIRVAYCIFSKLGNDPIHDMVAEIYGNNAIEIINTIIKKGYISSLQHAADMGIELHKAEIALKYNLDYIQDKDLIIKKK